MAITSIGKDLVFSKKNSDLLMKLMSDKPKRIYDFNGSIGHLRNKCHDTKIQK